jgi:hypothetical protein
MNLQRMKHPFSVIVISFALLAGCATQPIPELSQPQSAALAIDVTLLGTTLGFLSNKPHQIYFARVEGEDGLLQQQFIRSNYINDGRAYLLNARPGTYVVIGAFFWRSPTSRARNTIYFSKEIVEQSKVIVRENDFIFMGNYAVDTSLGLGGADETQTHYKNVIAPGAATSVLMMGFSGDEHYRGVLSKRKNDEQARAEFLPKAKEDLAGSGWAARIK